MKIIKLISFILLATIPSSPMNLVTGFNSGDWNLTFDSSTDNETPQAGLSYNIHLLKDGVPQWPALPVPYTQDFEGTWGSNGTPWEYPDFWEKEYISGYIKWEQYEGCHYEVGPSPAGGNNALFFNEDWSEPETMLYTPPLDLGNCTGNAKLTFWHIQKVWDGDQDTLGVYYRYPDWDPIGYPNKWSGEWTFITSFTENTPEWTLREIDLPDPGHRYQIGFRGYSYYGYGIGIDHVQVTGDMPVYANGSGTESDPYQVSNAIELDMVRNHLSSHFIQTADIDLSNAHWEQLSDGWMPIGNHLYYGVSPYEFTGSYDGNNFNITNLRIDRSMISYIGLFGVINGAELKNINLINSDITGDWYCGSITGINGGGSNITNCSVSGNVNGYGEVGGIIGLNTGSDLLNSYSTGIVTGHFCIGGLTGSNDYSAEIKYSYSMSNVTSTGSEAGGLSGENDNSSSISDCYSIGYVNGVDEVGGLIGELSSNSMIRRCYSTGSVSGTDLVGGLTGNDEGGYVTSSYWDTETSGIDSSSSGTGKTTVEMHTQSTYSGWDFSTPIWKIHSELNDGYPYLAWQPLYPFGSPPNVSCSISGTDLTLTWDPVNGAVSYKIYGSAEPYGTFSEVTGDGTFDGTSWSYPFSGTKRFYYVVAVDGIKGSDKSEIIEIHIKK